MSLKQLESLTNVEIKNFLREPVATVMMVTPAILLLIFAVAFGDDPAPGGLRMIDSQVPEFIAMGIAMIGIMNLPYAIAEYKAIKIFKRFRGTPMKLEYVLISQAVVNFLIVLVSSLALIGVAVVGWNIKFRVDILSFTLAFILSNLTFFSIGFVLAGLLRTTRAVEALTGILFFPLFMLSGIMIPLEVFPKVLRDLAEFNPVTHSVDILTATWLGNNLGDYSSEIIIMWLIAVFGTLLAVKTFRWE
jgi:ABC-2 type transport system permease protein